MKVRRSRVNDVFLSELFALALWLPVVGASFLWQTAWPDVWWSDDPRRFDWVSFVLLFFVSDFCFGKSALMAVRTWSWGRLGASLVLANFAFGVAYEMSLSFRLWPELAMDRWVRLGLLVFVFVCVLWGKYELIRTRDEEVTDDGYEELVRENEVMRDLIVRHGIALPVPDTEWDGDERRNLNVPGRRATDYGR